MKTQAQRIAYIEATFARLAKDKHYTQAQAAADIERVWSEEIDEHRTEAATAAAFYQSYYAGS
jgi:hypothetical protein